MSTNLNTRANVDRRGMYAKSRNNNKTTGGNIAFSLDDRVQERFIYTRELRIGDDLS